MSLTKYTRPLATSEKNMLQFHRIQDRAFVRAVHSTLVCILDF